MLTQRGKLFLIILVIALLIALLTQFELIYLICAVMTSIITASLLLFKLTLLKIKLKRKIPKAVYEDELIDVEVTIESQSFIPNFFIYLTDKFLAEQKSKQEKRILIPYLPKAALTWRYPALCFKRGVYWLGPFVLTGSDPLGLFKKTKILNISDKLTVYPKVFDIRDFPTFIKGMIIPRYGAETVRKSGEYEEFFGIREYRQEDGLRKIHWPSSAKRNELIVRHFEQSSSLEVTIALDLNKANNIGEGKETTLEYAVKIAASLSKYLLNKNASVQLLGWSDKPVITAGDRDPAHFFTILEVLARVEAYGYYPMEKAVMALNELITPNSTLIAIALDRDHQALKSMEYLIHKKNISIIYILLNAASFSQEIPESLPYFPQARVQNTKVFYIKRGENLQISLSFNA